MGAPPRDNLKPESDDAAKFIKDHPELSRDKVIATAQDSEYRKWFAEIYLRVPDLAPNFEEWSRIQDNEMRRWWDLLHPAA